MDEFYSIKNRRALAYIYFMSLLFIESFSPGSKKFLATFMNIGLEKHVVNNGADPVLGHNAGGSNANEAASVQGSRIDVDTPGFAPLIVHYCVKFGTFFAVCNFFRRTSKGKKNIRKRTTVEEGDEDFRDSDEEDENSLPFACFI